jgi:hypothetical protein
MNSALIIHLLTQVQHLIAGHRLPRGWRVFECFQSVQAARSHPAMVRMVCGVIHVWNHGVVMKWR